MSSTTPSQSARLAVAQRPLKRILLKISGESIGGEGKPGIDLVEVRKIAASCKAIQDMGRELAIVVGGGNIIRGATLAQHGMNRATADSMGMLATLINGLALQDVLEREMHVETRVLSAVSTHQCAEPYIRRRALRHLEKARIVILAGGTGNPYSTTDTTATLRALELEADILLKATKVDGVYSADPVKDPNAVLYKYLTYQQVRQQQLAVMDAQAIAMAMENNLPILVFDFKKPGNFQRAVQGEEIGTLISSDPE